MPDLNIRLQGRDRTQRATRSAQRNVRELERAATRAFVNIARSLPARWLV